MAFISARAPAPKIVIYKDNTGAEFVREGGSRAWRNCNPGNIEKGSFAEAHGSIGADTRFAIFPDERIGLAAVVSLLSSPSYRNLTLEQAINRYAPPSENNTVGYVKFVTEQTGLEKSVVLSTLSSASLGKLAKAIQTIEGWIEGKEYPNQPFATLQRGLAEPVSSAAVAAGDWMQVASTEAARPEHERSEWPDPGENPRILEYFRVAAPWFDAKSQGGDEVDWCAAFVNYCLETAGYPGTGHPGARSFYWNKNNHFLRLQKPQSGCIAVFRDAPYTDDEWKTGTGHVGFVVDWNDRTVDLLGGNQGRTVKRQTYELVQNSRRLEVFVMPVMN